MTSINVTVSNTVRDALSESDREQLDAWLNETRKKVNDELNQVMSDLLIYGCYVQKVAYINDEIVTKVVPYEDVIDNG